jgi:hypothetical protein
VAQSEEPIDNGAGKDWKKVFAEVGWDMTIEHGSANVPEPSGAAWSEAELHAALLAQRTSSDLDKEWRYHLLCVREMDDSGLLGVMYDAFGSDSNNVPREGAAVASHFGFDDEPHWGKVKNKRLGTTTPYFRTAVHELGHAMGLFHNAIDNGFLNRTVVIAQSAVTPVQFPDNVIWSYATDDQKRLRHMPDQYVRPGGTPFGTSYGTVPISPDDVAEIPNLELRVTPVLESVPLGAPVRVNLELVNKTSYAIPAPISIGLKSEFVSGTVTDPSGTTRNYAPLIRFVEEQEIKMLAPDASVLDSMTLLRGGQGSLFPAPGIYHIAVQAMWEIAGVPVSVSGAANVMVTPVVNDSHASAALKVLNEPDTLLVLAIGGDHLDKGIQAIQAALEDQTLRPHYAYIEAKRVGRKFKNRKPDLKGAAALISDDTIMSPGELKKAAELVQKADKGADDQATRKLATVLQEKASEIGADKATVELVNAL